MTYTQNIVDETRSRLCPLTVTLQHPVLKSQINQDMIGRLYPADQPNPEKYEI